MLMKKLLYLLFTIFLINNSFGQLPINGFANKVDFTTAASTQGLCAADINNDNKVDILTANITGSSIGVYINNATNGVINSTTFLSTFNLSTLSAQPQQIFVADINNDGKKDLLIGYSTGYQFSIFINNYVSGVMSASSFTRMDITAGNTPSGVCAGDLDGDGKLDIAVNNYSSSNIYVYRNTSLSSSSISFATPVSFSTGSSPNSIAVGNIDSDGKFDLAVTNYGGNSISVFRNTSSGIGNISFSTTTHSVQSSPYWIRLIDFDGDSNSEIICSNYYGASVSIYRNTALSGILMASRVDLSVSPGAYPQASAIADFTGDLKNDIAVSVSSNNVASIFQNLYSTGSLTSSSFSSITNFSTGSSPVGAVAADLDFDYRPDLVIANYGSTTISVFKNRNLSLEPTIAATNISCNALGNQILLNFSKGNGTKRLVVARLDSNSRMLPNDSNWYSSNDTFGLGSNLGSGNFVVYADTGSALTIKGLTTGNTYILDIYEYNGYGGFSNYFQTGVSSSTISLSYHYYSKSTGILNDTSTWGNNLDGSGVSPSSFNLPNTVYVLTNNSAPSLTSNFIITGLGSYLQIGDGINSLNFSIASGSILFVDSFVVKSGATITLVGGMISNKAFFDSLSTMQMVSSNAQVVPNFNYYDLVIAGSTKTMNSNVNVRNSFVMLTSINTGSNILTLGSSVTHPGNLIRSNGAIYGKFKRWFSNSTNSGSTGLFPLGDGVFYRPISVEFTSAPTSGGTIQAEFYSQNSGNLGLPLYDFSTSPLVEVNKASNSGFWRLSSTGITGGIYSTTLTGAGFYGISNPSLLRIVKRTTNNGAWAIQGTAIAGTGTTSIPVVSRTGLSGFGELTLAGDSTVNPLPVKWINFGGKIIDATAELTWTTAEEVNNNYFEIERSEIVSPNFKKIERISAKNSRGVNSYKFEDFNFGDLLGGAIYRIKQVDFDGKFSYSKEIILRPIIEIDEIKIWPNPAKDIVNIEGVNLETSVVDLLTLEGRCVLINKENGQLNTNGLEKGVYVLRIISNSRVYSKLLVID
jgi:hypothetical protein